MATPNLPDQFAYPASAIIEMVASWLVHLGVHLEGELQGLV